MSNIDTIWQFASIVPAQLNDLFDLTSDTWFVIAAVVTLWAYMILAPGRDSAES